MMQHWQQMLCIDYFQLIKEMALLFILKCTCTLERGQCFILKATGRVCSWFCFKLGETICSIISDVIYSPFFGQLGYGIKVTCLSVLLLSFFIFDFWWLPLLQLLLIELESAVGGGRHPERRIEIPI